MNEPKSAVVRARCTTALKRKVEAKAAEHNMALGEFVRWVLWQVVTGEVLPNPVTHIVEKHGGA